MSHCVLLVQLRRLTSEQQRTSWRASFGARKPSPSVQWSRPLPHTTLCAFRELNVSVGSLEGFSGDALEGSSEGEELGTFVGSPVGSLEGRELSASVDSLEGSSEGEELGTFVGSPVGSLEGRELASVDSLEGSSEGEELGTFSSPVKSDDASLCAFGPRVGSEVGADGIPDGSIDPHGKPSRNP